MPRASRVVVLAAALLSLALPSAVAAPLTPLRVGVPERENLQYLTLWVALGAGCFEHEGVAPQVVVADAPNRGGQLLLQHQADIALLQPPVFLGLIAQQQPIVLFANLLANDPIDLIVRPDVAAARHLDPEAPLVDRLNALRGLRIGVNNEPPRRLRALFALAGMNVDRDIDMRIIQAEDQVPAFSAGIVDALYTHTPYLEDAIVAHGAVVLINQSAGEVAPLSHGEVHSLATTKAFAIAHPDVVAAATRAVACAERLLRGDPDAAARALTKAGIAEPTPQHLAAIVSLYRAAVPDTPTVSADAIERDATLYPSRPAPPDVTKLSSADFVFNAAIPVLDLGVVNVTASGPELAPAVDTVGREDIQAHDAMTVDRAIEYLPGVTVDHKSPRNQTGISIGGFDTRQVPLYLDGIPAYIPYDGYVDLTRYLTSEIAEIQVAKGYTSPLLGPNVLGGVINVVSRRPQKSVEGEARIGTAAGSLIDSGLSVGSRHQRYFAQGSIDRLESDFYPISSAFAFNTTQPGVHRVNSAQRDRQYRARAGWTPRPQNSYVVSYSNQQGSAEVPPYSGSAPLCPAGITITTPCVTPKFWKWPEWNTDTVSFNSNTAMGGAGSMQLRAFYVRYANTMEMFDDASYSTMNLNASSGSTRNRDHSAGLSGEFGTHAFARHALGASFFVKDDAHSDTTTTFSRANVPATPAPLSDRDRQSSFGVHDAYTIASRITATAGFSADHLDGLEAPPGLPTDHVWSYNPVASVSLATEHAGSLFVAYAHKSRFPTLKDRYSYKAGRALPNPSLGPERAGTWTAGYTLALPARTVVEADAFHSDVRDEIENIFFLSPLCSAAGGGGGGAGGGGGRASAGTCQQAVNVGRDTHNGATISVRSSAIRRIAVDGNYSFLHRAISGAPGVFPTGTPTHKAVATATLLLPRGAAAILSAQHQDGIVAMSDNGLPLPTADFTIVDVSGQLPVRGRLRLQAGVKNLFDRDYFYWEGFPERGRNAYVTLRFAF